MIKNRNILKISLPKDLIIKKDSMNNLTPVDYNKIKRERMRNEQKINLSSSNQIKKIVKDEDALNYLKNKSLKYTNLCLTITHIYFNDLADEMLNYIKVVNTFHNSTNYFTISNNTTYKDLLIKKIKESGISNIRILEVENTGKDICPKLKVLKDLRENYKNETYAYVLMLHDKKHGSTNLGTEWRKTLCLDLTSKKALIDGLYQMSVDKDIKMIGSSGWLISGPLRGAVIGGTLYNQQNTLQHLKEVFNKLKIPLPQTLSFIGGTMFWCDFNILNNFFDNDRLRLSINEMNKEKGNFSEPSFTHIMERVLGHIFSKDNLKIGRL